MPPILDFSSAYPWLGSGFIAGLLFYWLVRALLGIDRRRIERLKTSQSALEETQRNAAELSNKVASLESEWARLMTELGQLQPRAALVPQFEQQLGELQQSIAAQQRRFEAINADYAAHRDRSAVEIAGLLQDIESHSGTGKYYEGEFNRLFAEHNDVNKHALALANDLKRTKAGLEAASRDAAEAVRLRSEIATLKSDTAALRDELDQLRGSQGSSAEATERLTSEYESKLKSAEAEYSTLAGESRKNAEEVTRLRSQLSAAPAPADPSAEITRLKDEVAKLTSSLAAATAAGQNGNSEQQSERSEFEALKKSLEETRLLAATRHDEISRLKAQLAAGPSEGEDFRRFKDALEAANRIAAGLPEKA